MKCFLSFVAFFLVISCSDSDKFNIEKKQQLWIDGIAYNMEKSGKTYLYAVLQSEKNCFSGTCTTIKDCYWVINGKCCISSKNLGVCNLKDYLWIIDNDTIPSFENPYDINYGKHFVKLVLVDAFGDSISDSTYIQRFKITLLSPVDKYEASKKDMIEFQYYINGIDTWEEGTWEETVYVSTDENVLENDTLLWKEGKALEDKFFKPPLNKQTYYWGVKAYNQYITFYSEIRSIWIKD